MRVKQRSVAGGIQRRQAEKVRTDAAVGEIEGSERRHALEFSERGDDQVRVLHDPIARHVQAREAPVRRQQRRQNLRAGAGRGHKRTAQPRIHGHFVQVKLPRW